MYFFLFTIMDHELKNLCLNINQLAACTDTHLQLKIVFFMYCHHRKNSKNDLTANQITVFYEFFH
jgi:hypothetical protein